jgi:hypothetical protein
MAVAVRRFGLVECRSDLWKGAGHRRLSDAVPAQRRTSTSAHRQSQRDVPVERSFRATITRTSSVSPTLTGCRKRRSLARQTVPGPGYAVPSAVEIRTEVHMPCATAPWNCVLAAYSGWTCVGLRSPDIAANRWMSSTESVRVNRAVSPIDVHQRGRDSYTIRSRQPTSDGCRPAHRPSRSTIPPPAS